VNTRITVFVVAVATILLGGCAAATDPVAGPASQTPTTAASTAPSSEPATEEPVVTEEPTTTEPAKDTAAIGQTLTYESGLAVRVVSAKVFNAGSYASGLSTGHRAVKVTWTITNGTDATLDLTGATARLTYGEDGTQAESVYTDGVGGMYPFEGSLQPGKKKTASSAFSVPKAGLAKITVEVEPEFDSQTAFFTGKVAAK